VGKGPKERREPGERARSEQEARRGIGRPADSRKGLGKEGKLGEAWGSPGSRGKVLSRAQGL
jgi:hypothetical protein